LNSDRRKKNLRSKDKRVKNPWPKQMEHQEKKTKGINNMEKELEPVKDDFHTISSQSRTNNQNHYKTTKDSR